MELYGFMGPATVSQHASKNRKKSSKIVVGVIGLEMPQKSYKLRLNRKGWHLCSFARKWRDLDRYSIRG